MKNHFKQLLNLFRAPKVNPAAPAACLKPEKQSKRETIDKFEKFIMSKLERHSAGLSLGAVHQAWVVEGIEPQITCGCLAVRLWRMRRRNLIRYSSKTEIATAVKRRLK